MQYYDIAIIGAGSGGITAAVNGAGMGKKVLLVDRNKPGGECTWSGCVPSKALIYQAQRVHIARQLVPDFSYDSQSVLKYVRQVREEVYRHENPEALSKLGITYMKGLAGFSGTKTLMIGEIEIRAKNIIISTGSSPFIPPIPGLHEVDYLSNETIFELKRLPESIIVLGGGAIGVELAQALGRLGVKVQLVEMMPTILFREEIEMVHLLQEKLVSEGVNLYLGTKAIKVASEDGNIKLSYESKEKNGTLTASSILVAVGRKPNTDDLNLDAANVQYERRGVIVNKKMQTSTKGIYAFGDVTGPYQFSHMANFQAIKASFNIILPFKQAINYEHVSWVTFTEPELARAGLTETEARERYGDKIRVYNFNMNDLDRTRTKGSSIERVKLILDKSWKIIGASLLADRAGEMIGEIQVIKSQGISYGKLSNIIHPYPCYSEVFQKIGKRVKIDSILNHPLVKLFRK